MVNVRGSLQIGLNTNSILPNSNLGGLKLVTEIFINQLNVFSILKMNYSK